MVQIKPPEGRRNPTLEEEHINGYFAHIGTSRSGHNFVKRNIFSYIGDPTGQTRKYLNLENYNPAHFHIQYSGVSFENYPNSKYILTTRSLLNWYSSMMHFMTRNRGIEGGNIVYKPGPQKIKALEDLRNKQVVTQAVVDANPEMLADPNVLIVPYEGFQFETVTDGKVLKPLTEFIDVFVKNTIEKWLNIAKEFKGVTNHVPEFVKIYYDQFFTDQAYRQQICSQVGGTYDELELDNVAKAGGGSSFDDKQFDGQATNMKVLERYKQWEIRGLDLDNNIFLNTIKDHEALNFYVNNFDVPQEEMDFINNL